MQVWVSALLLRPIAFALGFVGINSFHRDGRLLDSSKYYIGITENLEGRLKEHNSGKKGYSKQYTPWQIETYITFRDKFLAQEFERYLKIGSGHAFLKKRFLPNLNK